MTLRIPADARVLVCDSDSDVAEQLYEILPNVIVVGTEENAIHYLSNFDTDFIFLNCDSSSVVAGQEGNARKRLHGFGLSIAQFLQDTRNHGENVILYCEDCAANVEIAQLLPLARMIHLGSFRAAIAQDAHGLRQPQAR